MLGGPPLRVCIVGAGAIGGFLAGKLAQSGHAVSVIARGEHLQAIRNRGLTLCEVNAAPVGVALAAATDRLADVGRQDVVILALKAHQLADVAADLHACLGPQTAVVAVQNGIPWWYFHRINGAHEGRTLQTMDPTGILTRCIPSDRIIGAVAHKAANIARPGVIEYTDAAGDAFPVGELDGRSTDRIERISTMFAGAGIAAPVMPDIRAEKWYKLWGNLAFNPICALTHANCEEALSRRESRELALTLMEESRAVAESLGIRFRATPADRLERVRAIGPVRPSMLQDTEAGRPLEIDAMLGAVLELSRITGTRVPRLETLYACVKLLATVMDSQRVRIAREPLAG